jgi:hypothetical protein
MLCFEDLLIKRDFLESVRNIYKISYPIQEAWINKATNEILAVDLMISRISIDQQDLDIMPNNLIDSIHPALNYAIWCETCMDWKTEFTVDNSSLGILCQDCNEGLIKVIR